MRLKYAKKHRWMSNSDEGGHGRREASRVCGRLDIQNASLNALARDQFAS